MTRILINVLAVACACQIVNAEEVTFRNGEVTLAGSLFLPKGEGPHPAVVFAHGGGPIASRQKAKFLVEIGRRFQSKGIASLVFDKRGTGESSGEWTNPSFEELAGDVRAGMEFLQEHPGLRRDAIGLFGVSQGCWIASIVAARHNDVAFYVGWSGGGMAPEVQELYDDEQNLRINGFSDEVIAQARLLLERENEYYRTGKGGEKLISDLKEIRAEEWFDFTELPGSKWNASRGRGDKVELPDYETAKTLRKSLRFDFAKYLQKVRCPVLTVYGADDESTPVHIAAPGLMKHLKAGGNDTYKIEIFGGLGHSLSRNGGFAPEVFEVSIDWMKATVVPTEG
jgi:pimeloyl-ACP methyl ester carboxylesterase